MFHQLVVPIILLSLKHKSEVFEKFKAFQMYVKRQTGKPIKILHSNNGTEYINSAMNEYLASK